MAVAAAARRRLLLAPLLAALLLPASGCGERQPAAPATLVPAAAPPATAAGPSFAAGGPDLARYANPDGRFPRATAANWWQTAYAVDSYSRLAEIFPAHPVRRGDTPSPWRRAAREPTIQYASPAQFGSGWVDLDSYLARNPATGLLIAVGDTIQVERYQYGRTDMHQLTSFSMAKTICAILVGLAVADGAIRSIEDPAEAYVPALRGSEYGRTPIRHLLTMSSGVRFREDYDGNDDSARLSRAILGAGPGGAGAVTQFNTRDAAPGRRWYYASAETQVLGLVLRAAIGRPIADYLAERIWQPMGAESDASWVIDRTGQEATYAFFNATLRDYARLGMLLANGGVADGRQLIPADWLREMTRPHFSGSQTGRWYGYGFQTWIFPDNDGSFALLGVRGQVIFVDPARRLVLVHTAVRPDARDQRGADTTALWRAVKQAFPRRPA